MLAVGSSEREMGFRGKRKWLVREKKVEEEQPHLHLVWYVCCCVCGGDERCDEVEARVGCL